MLQKSSVRPKRAFNSFFSESEPVSKIAGLLGEQETIEARKQTAAEIIMIKVNNVERKSAIVNRVWSKKIYFEVDGRG